MSLLSRLFGYVSARIGHTPSGATVRLRCLAVFDAGRASVACLPFGSVSNAGPIQWVTVGAPGNAADTSPAGYGTVADSFQMMKYEFTNQQCTDFPNSVDANGSNPYSVYNASMGSGRGVCDPSSPPPCSWPSCRSCTLAKGKTATIHSHGNDRYGLRVRKVRVVAGCGEWCGSRG